jgi:hypothetical protein
MKNVLYIILLLLCGCATISAPDSFTRREIQTKDFTLVSWQKITNPQDTYKIYIEGDGYAFLADGRPSQDPIPKGTLMRELAFTDNSPNVIYLARPCQYVKSAICSKRYWSTARFAPEVINAEFSAVWQIAKDNPVILIGFSGGAQIAGLIATAKTGLKVKKIITIAGNLDHLAWTEYHHLPHLSESLNLESYQKQFATLNQIHYVGSNDKVMPPILAQKFIGNDALIIEIKGASHNNGWKPIFEPVHNER